MSLWYEEQALAEIYKAKADTWNYKAESDTLNHRILANFYSRNLLIILLKKQVVGSSRNFPRAELTALLDGRNIELLVVGGHERFSRKFLAPPHLNDMSWRCVAVK